MPPRGLRTGAAATAEELEAAAEVGLRVGDGGDSSTCSVCWARKWVAAAALAGHAALTRPPASPPAVTPQTHREGLVQPPHQGHRGGSACHSLGVVSLATCTALSLTGTRRNRQSLSVFIEM